MVKPELGTKRACPETGRNFYDLNKNPVVSPYTGKEYPLTFFYVEVEQKKPKEEAVKTAEAAEVSSESDEEEIDDTGPEIISLEDADEEVDLGSDNVDVDVGVDVVVDDDDADVIPDIPNVEIDDDDTKPNDDTFLEEDDGDTDLSNVIGTRDNDEKVDI